METPNLSYIHNLSGGDKEFEKNLLDIIKVEFPKEKNIYYTALEEKKNIKAAEIVHKIKHKISILGLEKSYTLAETYEHELRDDKTRLEPDFIAVLKIMTDFLDNI